MRTWVTRVLGMMRDVALDADRRLLRLVTDLALDWSALKQARTAQLSSLASIHTGVRAALPRVG
jgi:hypothetical protein